MSGTVSTLGTSFLTVTGGGTATSTAPTGGDTTPPTGSGTTPELPEEFKELKRQWTDAGRALKAINDDVDKKPYLPMKRMRATLGLYNTAMSSRDEPGAKNAVKAYQAILNEVNEEIADVARVRSKEWYRAQMRNAPVEDGRALARAEGELDTAEKECRQAIAQAREDYKTNPDKLHDLRGIEASLNDYTKQRDSDRKSQTVSYLDVIYVAGQGAETVGSVAWINALQERAEEVPPPTQEDLARQQGEAEWTLVKNNVVAKWNEFVSNDYDFAYRGPSIPGNLRTPYVVELCTDGKCFKIGTKVYKVGSSDTGGMSLKTPIPKDKQGYNATGGWVQSFIYHLSGTH